MAELTVVEEPQNPAGLHLRVLYDTDSVHTSIYDGDEFIAGGSGYVFVKNHDSWESARNEAVKQAHEKLAIIQKYGRPPATEFVTLDADLPA